MGGQKGGQKGVRKGGQKGGRGYITGLMTECQAYILNNPGAVRLLEEAWQCPSRVIVYGPSAVHAQRSL